MPLNDSQDDFELDGDIPVANVPSTLEDECIIRDELREAFAALLEYVSLHSNEERNAIKWFYLKAAHSRKHRGLLDVLLLLSAISCVLLSVMFVKS